MQKQIESKPAPANGRFGRIRSLMIIAVTFFAAFITTCASAQTYNITTVAGNGLVGSTGDGGAPLSARVDPEYGVAAGAGSDFYITSASYNVVRYVSGGVIDVLAGTLGTAGYTGDGGAATAATLISPVGIAYSGGSIYIADQGANVVRIVSSGIINTFAGSGVGGYTGDGGQATAATLGNPVAVAIDGSGNVYIADRGNNVIRMVNTSGVISTVAGTGVPGYTGDGGAAATATLNSPTGVACDASGNLFIADGGNNVIRVVNSGGTISTYAGTGTSSYSGDGGPATAATFSSLWGIATDGSGNLYIADVGNQRIRNVNSPSATISSIAGNGSLGFGGDGGPALAAELQLPHCVALSGTGNLYITDYQNNRVRECSPVNLPPVTAPNNTPVLRWPSAEPFNVSMINYAASPDSAIFAVAFDGAGKLVVYDVGTGLTGSVSVSNGIIIPDIIIANNPTNPRDYILAVAGGNHFSGNMELTFYDVTGVGTGGGPVVTLHSSAPSATFTNFGGVTADNTVHIDVIAEHAGSGLHNCATFVMTWDDFGLNQVRAARGNLSYYTVGGATNIGSGSQPDVAAIQRTSGSGWDTVGLITYINGSNLLLTEYDFTTTSTISTCTLDASPGIYQNPRIDANDDYTTNASGSVANYKVAVRYLLPAPYVDSTIRVYDDLMGCGAYFTPSSYMDFSGYGYSAPFYSHAHPVVAMTNPNQYTIYHTTTLSHNLDSCFYMMEPLDATTNYTFSPNAYYVVDSNGVYPGFSNAAVVPSRWPNGCSGSENYNYSTSALGVFGYRLDGTAEFKVSVTGSSFGFKPANPVGDQAGQANTWQMFPNPARDMITIVNGTGDNVATQYAVSDVAGRLLLSGNIANAATSVNIGTLSSGIYLLELYKGTHSCGTKKFVKD